MIQNITFEDGRKVYTAINHTFEENDITVVGPGNTIRGNKCIVNGTGCKIYGHKCTVAGPGNIIYTDDCNVSGPGNRFIVLPQENDADKMDIKAEIIDVGCASPGSFYCSTFELYNIAL